MTSDVFDLKDNTKLYEVLGVARTANDDDIKRAYRKLAVQYHPDKNPAGAETFKEINFAHTVLSDPEQRRMYDAKTLRSHIEGTAQKERDPAMDPNVELSTDDLRSFVERLHKQHTSDAEKRREFESKREAEARRRAEFERRNPDFQMPTVDAVPASSHHREEFQQFRKTADLVAAMHRAEAATKTGPGSVLDSLDVNNGYRPTTYETTTSALRRDSDPAPPVAPIPRDPTTSAGGTGAPMSQRQQMMMKFRAEREAKGMAPTTQPTEQREALAKSAHQFVRDGAKPLYEPDAEVHKQKRSNFDYHTFVQAKYNDGGVVGEAIMSDALKDYSSRK